MRFSSRTLAVHFCPRRLTVESVTVRLLAFVALALLGVSPHAAQILELSPAQGGPVLTLKPDSPVRKSISGNEIHRLLIRMDAGKYARLVVESSGTGLRINIFKPSGQAYASATCWQAGTRSLSILADRAGTYRVELSIQGQEGPELYDLRLEELRPLHPADSRRAQAEKVLDDAARLRVQWKADSIRKAIRKYDEALLLLDDASAQAQIHNFIGDAYQALSDTQKALAHYNQALALSRPGNVRWIEADALNAIASLHFMLGENQQAFDNSQRAYQVSVSARYRRGEARALTNLGGTYYGLGELSKSAKSIEDALQLLGELDDKHGQVEALVSLGYTLVELSEMERALNSYQQAVALSRTLHDRRLEAISLRALGNFRTLMGDRQEALTTLTLAMQVIEGIDDLPTKADVFGGLGYLYDGLGEKATALDYYERALSIFRSMNHRWGVAEVGMVIGGIHYSTADYPKALSYYQQSLSIFRALVMPRYEAWMLRDIGLIYDTIGDKQKALDYYRQALAITGSGQDQRYAAYILNYIGRTYESLGDWKAAMSYYEKALPLNRIAGDDAGEATTLYNMAHAERARNNLKVALSHAEAALRISESLRTKVSGNELRATYFGTIHQQFTLYTDILMRLHKESAASGYDVMAFEASERGRARSLLEALAESHAGIRQGVDAGLLKRESELQRQLNAKAERQIQLAGEKASEEKLAAVKRELDELTAEYQQIQGQIRASSPRYAALAHPEPLTLNDIQRKVLDSETLLLEYALGEERSFVWVVTSDSIKSFDLPTRVEVEKAARRIYELLTERNRQIKGETDEHKQARLARAEGQYAESSRELSAMLLGPIADELQRKRLVIVADGALQYVPFAALPIPVTNSKEVQDGFAPLIVEHEVVSLPSASVLALMRMELRGRQPAPKSVAVFADPVFEKSDERLMSTKIAGTRRRDVAVKQRNEPSGDGYSSVAAADVAQRALRDLDVLGDGSGIARLPFSRREAEAIVASVPAGDAMLALGFRANRVTATGRELTQYRIVHFATHGLLNSDHPELSGVLLSRFDEAGRSQDGFLQLHDIYNLNLPAELVVLSACQTALGKEIRGEGLVGLTRGFMYAGAARVVASLWKVDDAATAELMGKFYVAMLNENLRPADALRAAQLHMWQQRRWRSPYYWAAFTLQGEWR